MCVCVCVCVYVCIYIYIYIKANIDISQHKETNSIKIFPVPRLEVFYNIYY